MGKYYNALKAIYECVLPVSQIKGTFIVAIGLYLVFLGYHLKDNITIQRYVKVENKQHGGIAVLNGFKYPVPYTSLGTLIPVRLNNALDFLLVSSGWMDESLISALAKLITGLLALRLLWQFDFNDPFSPRHLKQVNTLAWTGMFIILAIYIKDFYTAQWFSVTYPNASGYRYNWGFSMFYLIPAIWLLRAVTVFYKSAVIARQEAELTI